MTALILQTFLCVSALAVGTDCNMPPNEQEEVETDMIFTIMRLLEVYEIKYPGVGVTNLGQVFEDLEREYPYAWHKQLLRFRRHAGFSNSIYEKYSWFPRGISHLSVPGDLVFMNAKPYPGPEGQMRRTVVLRVSDTIGQKYVRRELSEPQVQEIFRDAGIREPKPPSMPRPPPAPPEHRERLLSKIKDHVFGFAYVKGWSATTVLIVWYTILALPFLISTVVVVWIWRRYRT